MKTESSNMKTELSNMKTEPNTKTEVVLIQKLS